jgi:charged multivesicular body protein 6
LAQLEQLTSQVEFALVQKDVLFGLQQGTKVLQAINKEMGGLAAVEKLMGETEEARAYQEVSLPASLGSLKSGTCANAMLLSRM